MKGIIYMKRILALLLCLALFAGCDRAQLMQTDELEAIYEQNRELLEAAADEIQAVYADPELSEKLSSTFWIFPEGGIEWIKEPSAVRGDLWFSFSEYHYPENAEPDDAVTARVCDRLYPAVEPLISASVVDHVFRSDRSIQFIVLSEWGWEAFIAYQPNGGEPRGSLSEDLTIKEISPNWWVVTDHD